MDKTKTNKITQNVLRTTTTTTTAADAAALFQEMRLCFSQEKNLRHIHDRPVTSPAVSSRHALERAAEISESVCRPV